MRRTVLGLSAAGLLVCAPAHGDDLRQFQPSYSRPGGIVRPEDPEISPETDAPEHPADQMLQTEAPPPRKLSAGKGPKLQRPKSFEGRFVARPSGIEGREVPTRNDETGMVQP